MYLGNARNRTNVVLLQPATELRSPNKQLHSNLAHPRHIPLPRGKAVKGMRVAV